MASTAELEAEILADLEENPDAYTAPVNDVITIDPETKTINLPSSEELFGTEEEHGVERKYFKCPRIVGDNIDLFTHQIYISYMAVKDKNATFIPDSIPKSYWCDDVALDETGNYITFSWLLSGNVLASRGFVGFAVIAKSVEGDILKTRWKTAPAVGTVLMTLPDAGEGIAELYPDIITQLLDRMGAMEEIATVEAMQGYVDDYLGRNPVQLDSTLTDPEKAAPANVVGELKSDIANLGGGADVYVEPADDDIPKVFIDGEIPTTKDDVLATMQYVSKTLNFFAYLKIKCQGTSSMSYPKKNFTVELYSDEARETKIKKAFKDWGIEESKFVLKANYIDHSHARNIVSARLWNETVSSRSDYDTLPEELKTSPRHGAVDGFPIKVYTNGTYQGIYTWNIGKDAWMWNMDENNANHVLLCAEGNTDGVYAETTSNFRALWNGVDGSKPGWSVEVGTNSTAVKDSLNALISCVKDTDDETFKSTIGTYLDVNSAIDYYIHQYVICGLDGLAHNMLLGTYDLVKWRCGAYDMDATFGLWWDGSSFVSTNYACPEDYQEQFSLLWERIETVFLSELKKRYAELRKTVYSLPNMVTHFERFMDLIGADLYAEDLTIYTGIPSGSANNIKQIRNYIRDRLAYCDAEFEAMIEPVMCTGITLDVSTLTFTEEGSQTLNATVTPDGCTETIVWVSDNQSIATVSNGVVTAIANGSATITATCGNYSASCSVAVSGIAEPITVADSFAEAEWVIGEEYNKKTGEIDTVNDCYRTKKFTVSEDGRYKFTSTGGDNNRLSIWDENGNYIGNMMRITVVFLKAGYHYGFSCWDPSGFDTKSASLVHEEVTPSETISINLGELTWTSNGNRVEANISSYGLNISNIANVNMFFAPISEVGETVNPGELVVHMWENSVLVLMKFSTVEEVTAYFDENPTTLIINQ